MKDFSRQKGEGTWICTRQKSGLAIARSVSFRRWQGSIRQMTKLVLMRQFLMDWFKIPFLAEVKL